MFPSLHITQVNSRAGRVLLVQDQEGSATGDACLEEGAVCSPPAPGLPTERILAPHVLSSPWSKLRRGTVGRSAATCPQSRGWQVVSSVWRRTLPPPARISLELDAGPAGAQFWRSGDSALHLNRHQQQQQQQLQQQLLALLVEQSFLRIIPQIMTTIMMKSGHWKPLKDTSYS